MSKILMVNDYGDLGASYYLPFQTFGERTNDTDLLFTDDQHDEIVLVVFTGGADVTPALYGEKANPRTGNSPQRDEFEAKVFKRALELGKNMAGICRGSQFLCAMSGGKLVQHITGHGGNHDVRTDDGRLIQVSSTHHQMQLPPDNAVPVAWANPARSTCYEGPPGVDYHPDREHDVVWYPTTKGLGMQYHPEFMPQDSEGFKYCIELVKRFFELPEVAVA
jgi:gamma-glutamyl-gamma-aminobutyrate hydrolase PuuD